MVRSTESLSRQERGGGVRDKNGEREREKEREREGMCRNTTRAREFVRNKFPKTTSKQGKRSGEGGGGIRKQKREENKKTKKTNGAGPTTISLDPNVFE